MFFTHIWIITSKFLIVKTQKLNELFSSEKRLLIYFHISGIIIYQPTFFHA